MGCEIVSKKIAMIYKNNKHFQNNKYFQHFEFWYFGFLHCFLISKHNQQEKREALSCEIDGFFYEPKQVKCNILYFKSEVTEFGEQINNN